MTRKSLQWRWKSRRRRNLKKCLHAARKERKVLLKTLTLPLHQSVPSIWEERIHILVIFLLPTTVAFKFFFNHYRLGQSHKCYCVIKHGPQIKWMMKRWIQWDCIFTSIHPDCPLSESACLLLSLLWLLCPPACSLLSSLKLCSCSFLFRMRAVFSASV